MSKNHVPQLPRTGREQMPKPMTPVLRPKPNQAPVARVDGKPIEHAAATPVEIADGANNAAFSGKPGMPKARPAARKAASVAAGQRPAKPLTPRFKSAVFSNAPQNPFR